MKTFLSVLRTVFLFLLLILFILGVVALLGFLYVKVINLIGNQALRYLLSIIYFGAMAGLVMKLGRKGIAYILDRD